MWARASRYKAWQSSHATFSRPAMIARLSSSSKIESMIYWDCCHWGEQLQLVWIGALLCCDCAAAVLLLCCLLLLLVLSGGANTVGCASLIAVGTWSICGNVSVARAAAVTTVRASWCNLLAAVLAAVARLVLMLPLAVRRMLQE